MSSLFGQLKTLIAGTSHDLLDKAIDMNSLTMLRQYARDLESQVETLNGESATAAGQVRTLNREKDSLNNSIANTLAAGTRLKNSDVPNKDALLQSKASEVVTLRQSLTTKQQEIDTATAASSQLDLVLGKVRGKSQEINARIRTLESMDTTAKAKAHAADVIGKTSTLLGNAGTASIDDIAAKIQARSDVSDVKLERAVGEFTAANPDTTDPVAVNDVMAEF